MLIPTNLFAKKKQENVALSLLLSIFPIAFIAGNTIINLNLILFILFSLYLFKISIFNIRYSNLDKIIILFFFFIIFTGIFNDISLFLRNKELSLFRGPLYTTAKSIFFIRFLILYLILRFLIKNKKLNLSFFFITSFFCSLFVSIDIFIQFIFGKDIFGYEIIGRKLSGPFGDELIAGGYLQRFSLFGFFAIFFVKKNISIKNFLIVGFLFLIIIFPAIVLSGNRMPMLLFLFSIMLIIFSIKELRKQLISFFIVIIVIFTLVLNFSETANKNFKNFKSQIFSVVIFLKSENRDITTAPIHLKEFSTFYQTWLMNKYIGGGIKMFRYNCLKRPNIDKNFSIRTSGKRMKCNMHPHNYYLEILTETGILGFTTVVVIFMYIIYLSFFKNNLLKLNITKNYKLIPFIILLIIEIFPIKSTGSFFTTFNATYLFLILSITVASLKNHNLIEIKD